MAYYFIFPEKDATLYSHPERTTLNTGQDEILEIVKEKGNSDQRYYPSRTLIQFRTDDLRNVVNNVMGSNVYNSGNFKTNLKLFTSEHKNLTSILNLEVFPISESWDEGTGRYSNLPTSSNGCSWIFRDNDRDKTQWTTSSFGPGSSGSINASGITEGGGAWYTGSSFQGSQQFLNADNLDTNIDVTNIVKKHLSSILSSTTYPTGIPNHGLIVKQPDSVENDTSSSFGELQYFSANSHTIFPPKLSFRWDDSLHSSQSKAKQSGELSISLYRNQEEYNVGDEAIFRLHVRDKYPPRQFTSSSNFLNAGYLTTSSFYSIRDAHTEEEIIPFDDEYTKLSADNEGMFFKIFMKSLQPERYYRILFKSKNKEGVRVYDNNYNFKVVR